MRYMTQKLTDFKNNLIIILIIYYSTANIYESSFCETPVIACECAADADEPELLSPNAVSCV
uniref:Uncharacterized protein n=1 Tax=Romanomermis culicivorax TaxID=13658 RepID=A0A915KYJ5_ROMCU